MQDRFHWGRTEKWLEQRRDKIFPAGENFRVCGYEWRTLHFNDFTRESTVKVLVAQRGEEEESGSLCFMQQPRCLAVPCNFRLNFFLLQFKEAYLHKIVLFPCAPLNFGRS